MTTPQPSSFAHLLKRYRLAAGLTQEELAERARLSTRTISDLERGLHRAPYRETVALLAEALALSAGERAQLEAAARQHRLPLPVPPTRLTSSEPGLRSPEAPPPPAADPPHPAGSPKAERLVPAAPPPAPPTRRKLVAGLVVGLLVLALLGGVLPSEVVPAWSALAGQPPRTLCIATDSPTSGDHAAWGQALEHAVNLAVMQNQVLGKGYTLKVIHYNDRSPHDLTTGPQNVQQMVRNPCIVGMVGPYNSPVAIGEMPVAANAGLVMVSPSNTNPALTLRSYAAVQGIDFEQLHPPGKPINYFRIAPNDVAQGIVDADITFDDLGARSAYVVNDRYPYGEELASEFTQRFQVKGGRIVGAESILPGNPSLIAQVAASIVASRPDAVFYGGITEDGGGLLKAQLVRLGYAGPFVGGDGIAQDPAFVEQAGADASNGTFATVAAPDPSTFNSGAAATFVRDFHVRYPGQDLLPYCANAYDAAMLLITAIKQLIQAGQAVTRAALRDQVQHVRYAGVTGPISFDSNGDVAHGVFSLYTVRDGQWVFVQLLSA